MAGTRVALLAGLVALGAVAVACGGDSDSRQAKAPTKTGRAVDPTGSDDQSRCDFKGRNDREVRESTGFGSFQPNIRRVYKIVGEGVDARRVVQCREVDSNLDGMKDVVRIYDDKGEAFKEQADADFNGQVDTWITFASGRMAKVELDKNGDGKPDQFKHYIRGKLRRIERDSNFDGKPDVWEIYAGGVLERMGVDLDHDGHVDRWDRDQVAVRMAAERERKLEEEAEAKKKAKAEAADGGTDAYVSPRNR